MSLGFYRLINNFLSASECDRIISNLPSQTKLLIQDEFESSRFDVWYTNDITTRRIAVPVDKELEERISKQIIGDQFLSTGKMYITEYKQGESCKIHHDPAEVTAIVLLNSNFTGGEFILENLKVDLSPGDLLLFDKRKNHAVSEIISGNRFALSIWFNRVR